MVLIRYWDMLYGTYKDPAEVKHFNEFKEVIGEPDPVNGEGEIVDPNA